MKRLIVAVTGLFGLRPKWIIPKGDYCYKFKGKIKLDKYGMPYWETRHCPYYSMKNYNGVWMPHCAFLNKGSIPNGLTDEEMEKLVEYFGSEDAVFKNFPLFLLWDGVKECGEREYTDEDCEKQCSRA